MLCDLRGGVYLITLGLVTLMYILSSKSELMIPDKMCILETVLHPCVSYVVS